MKTTSHTFHIPVMGTGFTIDTPLKVARYGISSVISLVDDVLIEQIRKYHAETSGEPYEPIPHNSPDYRARRITAYLNLVHRLLEKQVQKLQSEPFSPGSDITRYYELLPECAQKEKYHRMLQSQPEEKAKLENELRQEAVPGTIDVNIMTKLDKALYQNGVPAGPEYSDAMSALRGFALSDLESSLVLSAGMNPHLYGYISQFEDFLPINGKLPKKSIILKVSDYRSAEIQGKFLAKKGVWISEFRIESSLNCGGHAFANKGHFVGPILEEFRTHKEDLRQSLFSLYSKALHHKNIVLESPLPTRVTVQGGIGTAEEDQMLRDFYKVDGTGWGTPFLLVPEATNVDDTHLRRLCQAEEKDVALSDSSPLGVPFWTLKTSESEAVRMERIEQDKPGSPCVKRFLISDTEFTEHPLCKASSAYQKMKINQLETAPMDQALREVIKNQVLAKSCICHDLAGGATIKYGIDTKATTAVCCGPNIVNFSKVATLEEMVGHIYGRGSIMSNPDRKHVFIEELKIYVNYFRKEVWKSSFEYFKIDPKYLAEFKENLLAGIEYYQAAAEKICKTDKDKFLSDLVRLKSEIENISFSEARPEPVSALI